MPDTLVPVRELLTQPPAGLLSLAIGPGLLSGFVDLPILVPGTVNPSYGIVLVVGTFPPAAGHDFGEVIRFQRPYLRVRMFASLGNGQQVIVETHDVEDAEAEVRWFAPGLARVTLEFAPGFEVHTNYLIWGR